MNRAATSAWAQPSMPVAGVGASGPQLANVPAASRSAARAPAQHASLVSMSKQLFPFVAGGLIILALVKIVWEKWVVKDPAELRGPRIDLYSFFVVGLMALTFEAGAGVALGWFSRIMQMFFGGSFIPPSSNS